MAVSPFWCGTQFLDWKHNNCERCAKCYEDGSEEGWRCDLEKALDAGAIGANDLITEEVLRRIGYREPGPGEEYQYVWRCPEFEPGEKRAVAISRGVPGWYEGRRYEPLAPLGWMVSMIKSAAPWQREKAQARFAVAYGRNILEHLDPEDVLVHLGDGAVLLCWEEPGEFCHRRIVAKWLREELGIRVDEVPRPGGEQGRLGLG
ncbi:MAG: hypothetical protein JRG73_21075 [Deltaproteobacteria bacterium]|nr:hypothetical protein [Deltaproteobacteria bacterium]